MGEFQLIQQDSIKGDSAKPEGEISRRDLLMKLSPLGKINLDSSKCTGCGLCAIECPTGALTVCEEVEKDYFQILFKHGKCVACNLCAEICPEKCLRMERILEMDKIDSQSVLFEDVIVRCSGCGNPIGPRAMFDKLQSRVVAAGPSFTSIPELCPVCKAQAQFVSPRM
jgi:ferredoxin